MPMQHIQDATFELPEGLNDRTVHMFALSDTGPSAFNLVLHRADAIEEETLAAFADRLHNELRRGLAKFDLKGRIERQIDGCPAIELSYTFRQDGQFLHQRQVLVFVHGANPDLPTALLVTGTCPKVFDTQWNETFDAMLESITLREPWGREPTESDSPVAVAVTPADLIGPTHWPIFALRDDTLQVLIDQLAADAEISTVDVAWGHWSFFDSAGQPLEPKVHSDTPAKPYAADRFELHTIERPTKKTLSGLIDTVATLYPNAQWATLTDVRRHLLKQSTRRPQG